MKGWVSRAAQPLVGRIVVTSQRHRHPLGHRRDSDTERAALAGLLAREQDEFQPHGGMAYMPVPMSVAGAPTRRRLGRAQ